MQKVAWIDVPQLRIHTERLPSHMVDLLILVYPGSTDIGTQIAFTNETHGLLVEKTVQELLPEESIESLVSI
jgi:hypothetical protein